VKNAAILDATLAAQREVVALDAAALDELERIYQAAADDIAQRIAAQAGADGNVPLWQLQDLLAQVNARLRALAQARDALLNQSLNAAAGLGTEPLTTSTPSLTLPLQGGGDIAAAGVLSGAAAMAINNAALQFVRTFVAEDGLQLSDRIWQLDRHARDVAVNAIERAIIEGHGAAQAARELLMRGESIPAELADKMNAGNARAMGKEVNALLTGEGSPMDNAMRLMRTEINRAHGEAYIKGFLAHPDAAGVKFVLSPAHPKFDICDLHASANLHGLGAGVYPDRESCPWPAHPNTLSFLIGVFTDQVTDADRAGKETPLDALGRLTSAQQIGALGRNKFEAFRDGKLTQGMIAAPWAAVEKRIGKTA